MHNPHYFEFLRRQANGAPIPRQPGDDGPQPECRNGLPSGWSLTLTLRDRWKLDGKHAHMVALTDALRQLSHIAHVELPRLRGRYAVEDNADLRVKFLVNDITEAEWQLHLQRREKKRNKDTAVRDIYQMALDTAGDAFRGLMGGMATPEETVELLDALRAYTNEHLHKVRQQYHQVVKLW